MHLSELNRILKRLPLRQARWCDRPTGLRTHPYASLVLGLDVVLERRPKPR